MLPLLLLLLPLLLYFVLRFVTYRQAEQGLQFDCTELHEYSYTFFANLAKVLEEDMSAHVERLVPHLLKEIQVYLYITYFSAVLYYRVYMRCSLPPNSAWRCPDRVRSFVSWVVSFHGSFVC